MPIRVMGTDCEEHNKIKAHISVLAGAYGQSYTWDKNEYEGKTQTEYLQCFKQP